MYAIRSYYATYFRRAENLGVELLDIRQTHLGTDGGLRLIKQLTAELEELGVEIRLETEMTGIDPVQKTITAGNQEIGYENLIIAPGRKGFRFLQSVMDRIDVSYIDHIVDIGIRIETRIENYPIVKDYYDPKFLFPGKVRNNFV